MDREPVIVIGAGPAGLTAAYELMKRGVKPIVLEKASQVGGMARTEIYKGYRFDIGGHRFFTEYDEIQRIWEDVLGDDLLVKVRMSRIYFKGRFIRYPLDLFNVLSNLGCRESIQILISYFKFKWKPSQEEQTFESWMIHRFGKRLYEIFFKPYTQKVWGIPCRELKAEMAKERIKGLSLSRAVFNALFGIGGAKSLIDRFYYPVLGPGLMWQRFQDRLVTNGAEVLVGVEVLRINCTGGRAQSVTVREGEGTREIKGSYVLSSMPLSELVPRISPQPPGYVLEAAGRLLYRDFILVGLIVDKKNLFPDQWIYVHGDEARVGRIQNFNNWSHEMAPDSEKTSLGMEYFCTRGDGLWDLSDEDLISMASRELSLLGLVDEADVYSGIVFRQPKAYPIYHMDYQKPLLVIKKSLGSIQNLCTIGRNGLHRYDNQDIAMLSAITAVGKIP